MTKVGGTGLYKATMMWSFVLSCMYLAISILSVITFQDVTWQQSFFYFDVNCPRQARLYV